MLSWRSTRRGSRVSGGWKEDRKIRLRCPVHQLCLHSVVARIFNTNRNWRCNQRIPGGITAYEENNQE